MDERDSIVRVILSERQKRYMGWKRILDIVLSFFAVLVLLLPCAVIVVVQKILAPGEPVFFFQMRYGMNGQLFRLMKFRSLKSSVDNYLPTGEALSSGEEMTAFGRFLRDSSLDELPQLLQVLSGKMSLVGPRPLIPQEEEMHRARAANGIYQVRPGITGWAQINGRDHVSGPEKVAYDREYIERMGLRMDAMILRKTVRAVLRRENIR